MKKKILAIIMIITITLGLVGCINSVEMDKNNGTSMFIVIEETLDWCVVYHKETKVMYAIGSTSKSFTVLVNADGTPMLYEGKSW